jgi:type III restriction enzyme
VFTFAETLKGFPTPDILASPLRRARVLAQLLTDDKSGSAFMPDAGQQLTKALNKRLDGLAAEYDEQAQKNADDIRTAQIHRERHSPFGEELESVDREVQTHVADIDRDTRKIMRQIKEGAGHDYYSHRVDKAGAGADRLEIRVDVAALLMIDAVVEALDQAATNWVQGRLEQFAVEIKNTTGATRNDYLRVQEQTAAPEPVDLILRDNVKTATRDGDGNPLPTFQGHLYADDSGAFPAVLNRWERIVVETHIGRPSFVAWYRNPARATAAALRIAYQSDAGDWTSLQPDFIVVSRRDDGSLGVSIIDPHGDHLADAKNKLKALARYAGFFGDQLVRIESITEASDGSLRSLDLKDESVREAVDEFTTSKSVRSTSQKCRCPSAERLLTSALRRGPMTDSERRRWSHNRVERTRRWRLRADQRCTARARHT